MVKQTDYQEADFNLSQHLYQCEQCQSGKPCVYGEELMLSALLCLRSVILEKTGDDNHKHEGN